MVDSYRTSQPTLLKPCLLVDELSVREIVSIISDLKSQITRLRNRHKDLDYVPCVIIVNSVVDAIHVEDEILKCHPDLVISPYRGLMSKSERKIESSHIIVGTSAIEVGIDFQCSYLIFEAGDASSFLQRFGRIGRHKINGQTPVAYAFLPRNLYEYISENDILELTRDELQELIKNHYPTYSSYAGFVCSDYGLVQAHIFVQRLQKLLKGWGEIKSHYKELIDSYVQELYTIFKVDEVRKKKIERRLLRSKWFNSYLKIVSFRSTLPSVWVYDKREERKGRTPFYETTVSDALARGTPCIILPNAERTFHSGKNKKVFSLEGVPMVLIENYNYHYTLTFDTIKHHELCAPFVCSDSDLTIQRKRENYHFASLFDGHIAMYIPSDYYWLTDWRIKKFKTEDSGKYVVFDGDVLLYLSILDKGNALEILKAKSENKILFDSVI